MAVGALGGQRAVQESAGDLLALPRQRGEDVTRRDEAAGNVLVVGGVPGFELDACPPPGLVVAGGPGRGLGIPDVLASQVVACGHSGGGFLGDLAPEGVGGGLPGFELAAGEVEEAIVCLDEHNATVGVKQKP